MADLCGNDDVRSQWAGPPQKVTRKASFRRRFELRFFGMLAAKAGDFIRQAQRKNKAVSMPADDSVARQAFSRQTQKQAGH